MADLSTDDQNVLSALCAITKERRIDPFTWVPRRDIPAHASLHPEYLTSGVRVRSVYLRWVAASLRNLYAFKCVELTRTHVRATPFGIAINDAHN